VHLDHHLDVLAIERGAFEIRELVVDLLVLVVERRWQRDRRGAGRLLKFVLRLGVLVHHHLRELLHLGVLRLLLRELPELNVRDVADGSSFDERLQVSLPAVALRLAGRFALAGTAHLACATRLTVRGDRACHRKHDPQRHCPVVG